MSMDEFRKLTPKVAAALRYVDLVWEGLTLRNHSCDERHAGCQAWTEDVAMPLGASSQVSIRFAALPIETLPLPVRSAVAAASVNTLSSSHPLRPHPVVSGHLNMRRQHIQLSAPPTPPFPALQLLPRLANAAAPPVGPTPLSGGSDSGTQTQEAASEEAGSEDGDEAGPVPSTGPVFMGQVFTMCDASRRGLIAVNNIERMPPIHRVPALPPFFKRLLVNLADRGLLPFVGKGGDGPIFHFFFQKDNAADYVKRVQSERFDNPELAQSVVGSCPLESAYSYFKEKPAMFRFVADERQVKVARQLLRREKGKKAASEFSGVPVFTARNLTIAMPTGSGIRWFTPYFFNKQQLDNLIGHSVDHYYQMLMQSRRVQRHSEPVQANFPPTEADADDPDSLLDPPEMAEFMEEMGQGGVPIESVLFRAAEVQVKDMVDSAFLGNRWGRRLIGLQPAFSVLVDSFERRAAAAEAEASKQHRDVQLRIPEPGATEGLGAAAAGGLRDNTSEEGLGGRATRPPGLNDRRVEKSDEPSAAHSSGHSGAPTWVGARGASGEDAAASGHEEHEGVEKPAGGDLENGGGVDWLGGGGGGGGGSFKKGAAELSAKESSSGADSDDKKGDEARVSGSTVAGKSSATFDFADWGWDFNARGGGDERERRGGGSGGGAGEGEGNEKEESRPEAAAQDGRPAPDKEEKRREDEPHLTWLGASVFASAEQRSDEALQKALMQVAKDVEDRMVKGKMGGEELGPLFIADLGDPNSFWGVSGQSGSVWEEEESE